MSKQASKLDELLFGIRVLPVVTLSSVDQAVPLAEALMAGGIKAMEVTLRTEAAIPAVRQIVDEVPKMTVGTGTVIHRVDLERSRDAGAKFAVSPGLTPALLGGAESMMSDIPLLPGAATASEVMAALGAGIERLKLFPAEAVGGRALLSSFAGPLRRARFCPTGGVTEESAGDYLGLPNVFCVGGSWIAPKDLLEAGDWEEITRRAKSASAK